MVKLTETQLQIKTQLENEYYVDPLYCRFGDALVFITDAGPAWATCYFGYMPADPGCFGFRTQGQVTLFSRNNDSTSIYNMQWTDLVQHLEVGDRIAVSCPEQGVFWSCGTMMIPRQPVNRTSGSTHVITASYANFLNIIQLVTTMDPVEEVEGGVAFLNGANGEWTNKDDVRRAKQKRQARQPRRAKPKRQRGAIQLSHCAQKYARAIADPFNPAGVGSCVPVYPAPPSYKVSAHQRVFTVSVGSNGFGAFRFNPSPFSDKTCFVGTLSNFDGTTFEQYSGAEWTGSGFSTLPFASNDGVQARVVSASARVTYTGTALDLSGMFVSMVDPDHEPLPVTSLSASSALPYARVENTKRRMSNLSPVFGIKPHETDYSNLSYPLSTYTGSTVGDALNAAPCGFMVSGVPGTTFNVELIIHVEYIGRPAVAGLSRSHTDSRGFEMVQQAGAQLASYLASSATAAWPTMRRLLVQAGRDILLGGAGNGMLRLEL